MTGKGSIAIGVFLLLTLGVVTMVATPPVFSPKLVLTAVYDPTKCGERRPIRVDVQNVDDRWVGVVGWQLVVTGRQSASAARVEITERLGGRQTKTSCVPVPDGFDWVSRNNLKVEKSFVAEHGNGE